jgi:hypothetical protein
MTISHGTLLLIVRRDQTALPFAVELGRVEGITTIVDRRHAERRQQEKLRIAIQRRRAERRARTWVDAGLAAQGAVLVRV